MATKFEVLLSAKLSKDSVSQIQKQLKDISNNTPIQLKADTSSISNLKKSLGGLGDTMEKTKSQSDSLGNAVSKFAQWQIIGDIIHGVKDGLSDMVEQVFELDGALVEFNKVTDLTHEEMEQFVEDAYNVGEQLARTGQDVIEAATAFSKSGYKESALELAETALLYQNIADEEISAADAASLLVSQMKAFDIEASNSIEIIDKINEVSNNFGVSSAQLATALPKVSATLSQAGNSLGESIALITAGSEIMVGQSDRVARGLRSVTLNLQGMNDEGEQNLELVAAMETDFNKLGLTLYDTDGQMKSTFDILKGLAEVYPTLDKNTRNYYSALIGGRVLPQHTVMCVKYELNCWKPLKT